MPTATLKRSQAQVKAGDHRFLIDDKIEPLYGGAVHYWRLDRDKWDGILEKVKDMGFNTVSTYIPWEVHELSRGKFDFGEKDPRKDIEAFLELLEKKKLHIVARPGPQINSELTWFGYPRRILEDPELQAKSAQDSKVVLAQVPRPIPALSYAADKFFQETAPWYGAICPILARHKHPQGGLVAVQVDNEMAYFFHVNPYACDFSASSLRNYRSWLRAKYGTLKELNSAHGRTYASFDKAEAPRRFEAKQREDIPFHTDWIEYRERYLVDSLARLADMMKERGLDGIPLFHNYPHPLGPGGAVSGITTPFNLPALEEKLDFVGFDIYSRKELYDHVKTVVSYVVGTSRYPYIPEFIAGVWPWYLHPGGLADEEFVTKTALMHGIKGFSRYMIVERDRWLDSPVRRDGRVRPDRAAMFRRANEMATRFHFTELERRADVLLLANRDYDRLEAASVLLSFPGDFLETLLGFSEYPNFMTVSENALGFEEPVQLAKAEWFTRLYRGLSEMGAAFLLGDSDLPAEKLKPYKALVTTSFEYMNASLQKKLTAFAREGGTVVLGPGLPQWDERMRKDETLRSALKSAPSQPLTAVGTTVGKLYSLGKGRVVHLASLPAPQSVLEAALKEAGLLRFIKNDARLDLSVLAPPGAPGRVVAFVANPTAEPLETRVGVGVSLKGVRDIWNEKDIRWHGETWEDDLSAYTIGVYECLLA